MNLQASAGQPAVFLDRDGTLIAEVPFLSRPEQVELLPDAAESLGKLQTAGFSLVIVTNQSGVGRGLMSEDDVEQVHEHMCQLFHHKDVTFDAILHCPTKPATSDRTTIEDFYRKPGPGMLLSAAEQLELDLSRSWMIGDRLSDLFAGQNAGCCGSILVETGHGLSSDEEWYREDFVTTTDLLSAADWILKHS